MVYIWLLSASTGPLQALITLDDTAATYYQVTMLPDSLFKTLMPPIEGLNEATHEEGDRTIQVSLLSF